MKFAFTENRVLFDRLRLTRRGEPSCVELMFAWTKRTHGRNARMGVTCSPVQRHNGDTVTICQSDFAVVPREFDKRSVAKR